VHLSAELVHRQCVVVGCLLHRHFSGRMAVAAVQPLRMFAAVFFRRLETGEAGHFNFYKFFDMCGLYDAKRVP
jgi:hypothetical protein